MNQDDYVIECKRLFESRPEYTVEGMNAVETVSRLAIECDIHPNDLVNFIIIGLKLLEREQHV